MTNTEFRYEVIRRGLLRQWVETCIRLKAIGVKTPMSEFRRNLSPLRIRDFLCLGYIEPLYVRHLDRMIRSKPKAYKPFRPLPPAFGIWNQWNIYGLFTLGYLPPYETDDGRVITYHPRFHIEPLPPMLRQQVI